MTTTPDSKVVREIAREAIRSASRRLELIDGVIARHRAIGDRPASGSGELLAWQAAYSALCKAVRLEMQAAFWSDEQAQDERDAQLADLATELDVANDDADAIAGQRAAQRKEIMRLRARVQELEGAQGERDGDVPDPADVPDEWLQAAFDAIGRSGAADGDEQMRNVLAAVLPLYRQRMRNGDIEYAAGLEAGDTKGGE